MARDARWDDIVLAVLMLVLAAPRVVLALAHHEAFGAETTVAAIFTALGLLLLATANRVRRD
jgi:hypothetical protein